MRSLRPHAPQARDSVLGSRARWAALLVAVAVGALVLAHGPAAPGRHRAAPPTHPVAPSHPAAPTHRAAPAEDPTGAEPVVPADPADAVAGAATGEITMVATNRVELRRRRGYVTGDGTTTYVANRTDFRPAATRVALPPRVRARAWVVADLDSGRLLGKHRARAELPQASTMKLLSALTAVRTISPGARHRVSRFEKRQTCACAGLERGGVYARNTLLTGMLLPSGNDAAEAVAGSHPHGRRAFYRAMNDLAVTLGATDTVARNASGLTAPGSHSTARDLVVLLRGAVADPTIARILGRRSARIATVTGRHPHVVWRATDYVNRYPRSLGKSGWTTPAQNTLAVVTVVGGRRIAVASLGAPTGYSTSGARALTRWAGANADRLESVGRLPPS